MDANGRETGGFRPDHDHLHPPSAERHRWDERYSAPDRTAFREPNALVVEEAGGRFSDAAGAARFDGRSAVSSNGLLHDELLGLHG